MKVKSPLSSTRLEGALIPQEHNSVNSSLKRTDFSEKRCFFFLLINSLHLRLQLFKQKLPPKNGLRSKKLYCPVNLLCNHLIKN